MPEPAYALVADPDKTLAARLARTVTDTTSLPCRVASDGQEGHAILAQHGIPALVVTELGLPKRDGFALIRGLRRLDARRSARVVALSAAPAVRTAAQDLAGELGPIVVLSKPVDEVLFTRALVPPAPKPKVVGRPAMPSLPPLPPPPRAANEVEEARLRRIEELRIVDDAPPDETLQRIVADVSTSFGVPTAMVTVVLESRQWIKAYVGLTGDLLRDRGSPRAISFCHHVVEGRAPLIVPDARAHPLFAKNPLVVNGTIGAYIGAPITTTDGQVLGALCIVDTKPLETSAPDVERLVALADDVGRALTSPGAAREG